MGRQLRVLMLGLAFTVVAVGFAYAVPRSIHVAAGRHPARVARPGAPDAPRRGEEPGRTGASDSPAPSESEGSGGGEGFDGRRTPWCSTERGRPADPEAERGRSCGRGSERLAASRRRDSSRTRSETPAGERLQDPRAAEPGGGQDGSRGPRKARGAKPVKEKAARQPKDKPVKEKAATQPKDKPVRDGAPTRPAPGKRNEPAQESADAPDHAPTPRRDGKAGSGRAPGQKPAKPQQRSGEAAATDVRDDGGTIVEDR
ncbi:MAG: hypothetical protein ACRDJ5_09895 [Actinomycetota bacterium]